MPIDQMTLLEKRVHQILELVKRLRQDNTFLEQKVRTISQQLAKRERDTLRWSHDRVRLRSRVKRILSEMETGAARREPAEATGSRKRGET
ncbi:MAG TPA: hypothetical protein VMN77_05160 [Nitrospiria bacterium]|jgi:hypothetical protein|nr:hypothetical protein [Nitrospiria bacterium]